MSKAAEPPAGKSLRPRREPPKAGPAPTEARLREAALHHLTRFAATEAGLRRVLQNRVARWGQRALAEGADPGVVGSAVAAGRAAAASVAQRLVAAGAVDDAAFAAARARRLARSGRSRRAIAAHLAAKGVAQSTATAALPEGPQAELDAALAYCRRRRLGPFATTPPLAEARPKALAALGRAGFDRDTAEQVLDLDPVAAAERLAELRRGT